MSRVRVCDLDAVAPAAALRVQVNNAAGKQYSVCIARDSDGSWHALGDTCTHGNISLAEGEVYEGGIECWKHGSVFDLVTGHPRTLPATKPVPVYELQIDESVVYVDVDKVLEDF